MLWFAIWTSWMSVFSAEVFGGQTKTVFIVPFKVQLRFILQIDVPLPRGCLSGCRSFSVNTIFASLPPSKWNAWQYFPINKCNVPRGVHFEKVFLLRRKKTLKRMSRSQKWEERKDKKYFQVPKSISRSQKWEERKDKKYFQVPKKRGGALRGFKARLRLPSSYRWQQVCTNLYRWQHKTCKMVIMNICKVSNGQSCAPTRTYF